MKQQILAELEKKSVSELGRFTPPLLNLEVSHSRKDVLNRKVDREVFARVFFHEFVHFLQALGSTYELNRHFETMDFIAQSIKEMGGLADRMPLTAILTLIGFLAIGGVPPTMGFVSKFMIFSGTFNSALTSSNTQVTIAIIAIIMTALTVG